MRQDLQVKGLLLEQVAGRVKESAVDYAMGAKLTRQLALIVDKYVVRKAKHRVGRYDNSVVSQLQVQQQKHPLRLAEVMVLTS